MTARTSGAESFDAFWAEVARSGRTTVIRGVQVPVPTDLPLAVEQRISDLRESSAEEDVAELLAMLFGGDVLDQWRDAGMGLIELQTVMTWALAQASGQDMAFAEALELVRSGGGEGKPPAPAGPNRAARRATPRKPSARTGGRSKRTSSASTGSVRKTSAA